MQSMHRARSLNARLEINVTNRKNVSPMTLDAIISQARAENAQNVRMAAAGLQAKLKRFATRLRPIKARTPRTGAFA
jgi:hypothetical protein